MVGITSYGAYVPYNRLKRSAIGEALGKNAGSGEKAVAYHDEDSLTMAISAAFQCIRGKDVKALSGIFFATTTSPYKEKQCATNIAAVLDCSANLRTADYTSTLRAASQAMLSAIDAAREGSEYLIAAADCRLGAADSNFEMDLGDMAAAFTFGEENVIAKVVESVSLARDFHDNWRAEHDEYVRSWDPRFGSVRGYQLMVAAALKEMIRKTGIPVSDINKLVLHGASSRFIAQAASLLGFQPEQVQDDYEKVFGNGGTAAGPLMLVGALEQAKPGDKILFINYGEGCDCILFEVTEAIAKLSSRTTIKDYMTVKNDTMNYVKYLKWKEMLDFEPARRPAQQRSSLPDFHRNYFKNYALHGSKCTVCGTPQFPSSRVCIQCQSIDKFEDYHFQQRKAKVATFAIDYLALSKDSPNMVVVLDFEGGGRLFTNMVDCDQNELAVGLEVEMSYRRLFVVDGIHTYFWKAMPMRTGTAEVI